MNQHFNNRLNNNSIKRYSCNTSLGAVFAEKFNRTNRYLLKKAVFENGGGNCIYILPTLTKQNNNRKHSLTKLTPIQPSLNKNEGFVYQNLNFIRQKRPCKTENSIERACRKS